MNSRRPIHSYFFLHKHRCACEPKWKKNLCSKHIQIISFGSAIFFLFLFELYCCCCFIYNLFAYALRVCVFWFEVRYSNKMCAPLPRICKIYRFFCVLRLSLFLILHLPTKLKINKCPYCFLMQSILFCVCIIIIASWCFFSLLVFLFHSNIIMSICCCLLFVAVVAFFLRTAHVTAVVSY